MPWNFPDVKEMLKIEPNVNGKIVRAFHVPDKVIYAHPFAAAVAVEAKMLGAENSPVIPAPITPIFSIPALF